MSIDRSGSPARGPAASAGRLGLDAEGQVVALFQPELGFEFLDGRNQFFHETADAIRARDREQRTVRPSTC